MKKSASAAGLVRLADFSRMAVYQGRRAEREGRPMAASLAYGAAVALDDTSFDAAASLAGFHFRKGSLGEAISESARAAATAFASAESRLSLFSSLAIGVALAAAATAFAVAAGLFAANFRRIFHDLKEAARWPFGHRVAMPIAFVLLALPVFATFGPVWLLLYWAALAYAYAGRAGRGVLAYGLLALGFAPLAVDAVARENLVRRSPLDLAAINLEERRDDATVEDALLAAATSFPDDPDVWFLLALYAERNGDTDTALAAYGRAIRADARDYRAYVNRGNVRFSYGDFAQAIEDYEEAAKLAPRSAEAFYNLAVARSEIYDFKGQQAARARAREISPREFDLWSAHPPAARVVPSAYRVSHARERLRARMESVDPLRPGSAFSPPGQLLRSPWCLAPWGALVLALLFAALRWRRGVASECARCGRAFCSLCKRYGGPPSYCGRCVRLAASRSDVSEDVREEDRKGILRRRSARRWLVRLMSVAAPGVHGFFAGRPYAAAATLFFFFLLLATAFAGIFGLRPLAPAEATMPVRMAVLALAALVWLAAQAGAWRQSREP